MQTKPKFNKLLVCLLTSVMLVFASYGCDPTDPTDTDTDTDTGGAVIQGEHVDNPFSGAQGYINPDWANKVIDAAGSLGSRASSVANYPTAVWLDRIAAIEGTDEVTGLEEHLDNALADGSDYIMIVVYDLPNRDCAAYASNGELLVAEDGMNRYKNEYIDPIADIVSDSKYAGLRIIAIVEPDSLPNLVTNVSGDLASESCKEADQSGAYVEGIQYAVDSLSTNSNVYLYVDIAHSGWLGWDDNFDDAVQLYASTFRGRMDSIDGFVTNTANYTPTEEPFLTNPAMDFNGMPMRSADFYEWNPYFDELNYATDMRRAMVNAGFPSGIGMLIDTSRNGWGGPDRPIRVSSSSDLETYVNDSRIDTRPHRGCWCNQDGAGIGERPTARPSSGIDAYVWVKPPGESDGVASAGVIDPDDPNKTFDTMCDPNAQSRYNEDYGTNALPGAPHAGRWFQEQFEMLVENAEPSL
jgi:cellulose 1,4-beta-cellobiosidase